MSERLGEYAGYSRRFQVDIPCKLVEALADYQSLHPDISTDAVVAAALESFLVGADKASAEIPIELLRELHQASKWAAIALRQWVILAAFSEIAETPLPLEALVEQAKFATAWAEEFIPRSGGEAIARP